MKIDNLHTLYVHELKDIFSAEHQILKALPDMIEKSSDSALREALEAHLEQTKVHVERVTSLFEGLDYEPGGHRCKGIEGLLSESTALLGEVSDDSTIDAAIIASCQRIEHYEMAAYGVARAFARKLGRNDDAAVLTETLEEEGAADRKLTDLAEHHVNFLATTS